MKKQLCNATSAAALAVWLAAGTARGYDLPTVNLGFTSFLDGGPPAGPGLYAVPYYNFYHSEHFRGAPFTGQLSVNAGLIQAIYQTDWKLPLGAKPGLDVIMPFAGFDLKDAPLKVNSGGMGDLLIGPYLQWDPIMGKNGPIFMHRIEVQCITPTGKYDPTCTFNPGANFFSLDPYWSGTVFLTPKWTFSTRVHYLWNDVNGDPIRDFPPASPYFGAAETQAGQAVHLNFATDYELLKSFHVGLNGYYLKQVTDTLADGRHIANSEEQVLGLGPGVLWSVNKNNHLFVNTYFETAAENKTEGFRLNLRYVRHF